MLDLRDADEFTDAERVRRGQGNLREHTLTLVGVQNAQPAQLEAAATRRAGELRPDRDPAAPAARAPAAAAAAEPARRAAAAAPQKRLVTAPVRSGTQIYARGSDLVVTAAVSPGAELVADGNIHVYGALRGRALAGASGDTAARIFCTRLEAELVSIAGRYLVSEQMPPEQRGSPVQIALVDDRLTITRN